IVLIALALVVMRDGPATLGLGPDGDPPSVASRDRTPDDRRPRRAALRTWHFWTVSAPFALGLAAQVGVLTHLVALVSPTVGPRAHFSALIGLVVAINQFTFAFGPTLVGIARDVSGRGAPALALCIVLEAVAAVIVLRGPRYNR